MKPLEYRANFDTRATDDGAGITGYSSTFWVVDSYVTAMAPGAFQRTLAERGDRIPLLYNHDHNVNIGVPDVQREDERGLYLEARIFDDGADGTTLTRRLRAGARYGFSFGFQRLNSRAATEDDPIELRQTPDVTHKDVEIITEVKMYEHSVVTFPANETADILTVRHQATADALRAMLDDARDNRLSDDERDLLRQIVAAFPASPDGTTAPGPDLLARRIQAEAALARMRYLTPQMMTG